MVSLRLWLAIRRCAALSMAFWVMDVVDVLVAVVCLLVRQAEIMSATDTMNMMQFMCFAFMVEYVFCISICTKISNLCITAK